MKHKLWITLITCLAYCIDKELWKALEYLKEQVRVLKEQQEAKPARSSASNAWVGYFGLAAMIRNHQSPIRAVGRQLFPPSSCPTYGAKSSIWQYNRAS